MSRTRARGTAKMLLSCIAILALSACATEAGDSPSTEDGEAARTRLAGLYVGTSVIRTAEELLVSECMRGAGFQYEPQLQESDNELPKDYSDDVDSARREGFRLKDQERRADALLEKEAQALPGTEGGQALREALFGNDDQLVTVDIAGLGVQAPGGGCTAEAQVSLFGSVEQAVIADELLSNVLQMQVDNAENQASVLDVFSQWQSCMESRGYDGVEARNFGRGLAASNYETQPTSEAFANEVKIATDDAECDSEAGYSAVRANAENQAFATFLNENEEIFVSVLEVQQDAQANARKALG